MATKQKRLISADDLYDLHLLTGARISPDGKTIIYSVQRVDRKTQKKYSNLWVVSTDSGDSRQFTYGDQKDTSPRWSPDGTKIAFLSNRANQDKPAQIYLISFHGGEAQPITEIKGEISNLLWSPKGDKLVCNVRKIDDEVIEREKDENQKKLGPVNRVVDRLMYKLDGYGYLPKERTHLWIIDTATHKSKQLTDHKVYDEHYPAFSPDGKSIAFTSNRTNEPDANLDAIDLYVMPTSGGEFRKIPTPAGEKYMPSFSPDGKWIAYYGTEGEWLGYKNTDLWVVPSDGAALSTNLTGHFDINVSTSVINDTGEAEIMPPVWSQDGKSIYFPITIHGSSILKKINVAEITMETIVEEGGAIGSYTFSSDQSKLGYFYGSFLDPTQLQIMQLSTRTKRFLTSPNSKLLQNIRLGDIEEVWFKSPDGNDLQGWILYPPDFDPNKKYPSILEIHGGPITQYGKFFMHEFYYLASKGYVVYFCNPRGGRGYGEAHTKAIWGRWGTADYKDLMAWADLVASKAFIDQDRMGVTGGSYGGYMTLWIIGHTHRFKAAVAQRCVSNFISMWGSSDLNWIFQHELEAGAPFEDLQKYWDLSPMKYIGNARTPTLIIHNEFDLRCPIEQGEQAFVALKRIGVETEMVRFPDEFHGLSRNGRTDRRIARLNHILRWFEKYLK